MERWFCRSKKCKCCIKWNESRETFGGIVEQNSDKDSEAGLNRQILSNSVKRKALEDLCERTRKLILKEPQNQDLDTWTLSLTHTHRTLGGHS
jgi:hypothetical protein